MRAKVLVIAGGGGGGNNAGAGGGAGGYIYRPTYVLTPQTYTVTVGAGGTGGDGNANGIRFNGANGSNSVFGTLTAIGGGGGCAGGAGPTSSNGESGGSGGGASDYGARASGTGGAGTGGQGYKGGDASTTGNYLVSGGGGGAGGAAPNITNNGANEGGVGGAGVSSDITGEAVVRASGGSGYLQATATEGGGGASGADGTANTGGGGGGNSGNGGSGVVIISYVTADFNLVTITGASNTQTVVGDNTVCVFNESGNFTVQGIKKLSGKTQATVKKVNTFIHQPLEIEGSALDVATLKAYYRFTSGALTTDSSGNGHTLTAISDPAETTGVFAGGVDLDGNDGYSATDHADFKPTGAFSVSAWVKANLITGNQYIFQSFSANTNYAGFIVYIKAAKDQGVIFFASGKNTGTTRNTDLKAIDGSTTVADNLWHQVVVVWDGSYLYLYVDGVEDATPVAWANAPVYAATNYVRIGCYNGSGTNNLFFTGQLDEVALWNGKALSALEISQMYNRVKRIMKVNNI
jgi:hypothetical protein